MAEKAYLMANEELIRNLIQGGVEWWNVNREEVRNRPFDHRGFDPLYFGDLSDVNFWWAFRDYGLPDEQWPISLAAIDFVEAFLDHTMLRLVDLTDADLYGAFVREANLNETKLVDADIRDADLQKTSLIKADLTRADLRGTVLTGANLQGAELTNANLTTADLVGADLSQTEPWKALLFPKPSMSLRACSRYWVGVWYGWGMEITQEQYERVAHCFPIQRGNVKLSNLQVLNAILYVAEHGSKWRGLPARFGRWHTVYMRMSRWAKSGVLDRVFEALQREQIVRIKLETVSMDSTIVKVHPDGTGALKKGVRNRSGSPGAGGPPRFIWLPRMIGPQ